MNLHTTARINLTNITLQSTQRKPDDKSVHCGMSFLQFKNERNYSLMLEPKVVVIFWGDKEMFYFLIWVVVTWLNSSCENSSSCTFKICALFRITLYFNK